MCLIVNASEPWLRHIYALIYWFQRFHVVLANSDVVRSSCNHCSIWLGSSRDIILNITDILVKAYLDFPFWTFRARNKVKKPKEDFIPFKSTESNWIGFGFILVYLWLWKKCMVYPNILLLIWKNIEHK